MPSYKKYFWSNMRSVGLLFLPSLLCAQPPYGERHGAQNRLAWIQSLALLLTGFVTWGKALALSEPCFSHLKMG